MTWRTSPLEVLCACLSPRGGAAEARAALEGGEVDWSGLMRLAGDHLVTPALARALRNKGIQDAPPADVGEYLESVQALNRRRNETLRAKLAEAVHLLNGLDVAPVLLKGAAALVPHAYDGAEDRVIGDLDLLVPPAKVEGATRVLLAAGYGSSPVAEDETHHHATALLHRSLPVKIELHRRFLDDVEDSAAMETGFAPGETTLEGGARASTPDVATRLLVNALHAQITDKLWRSRNPSLRSLLEFAALAPLCPPDAAKDAVFRRLRPERLDAVLDHWALAERWLGAPCPAGLPRPRGQTERLRLVEAQASGRLWLRASLRLRSVLLRDGANAIPSRLIRRLGLARGDPGYFGRRLRDIFR